MCHRNEKQAKPAETPATRDTNEKQNYSKCHEYIRIRIELNCMKWNMRSTYRSLSIYSGDRQLETIGIGTVDNIGIWHWRFEWHSHRVYGRQSIQWRALHLRASICLCAKFYVKYFGSDTVCRAIECASLGLLRWPYYPTVAATANRFDTAQTAQ